MATIGWSMQRASVELHKQAPRYSIDRRSPVVYKFVSTMGYSTPGAHEPPKAAKERLTSKDMYIVVHHTFWFIPYMEEVCGTA